VTHRLHINIILCSYNYTFLLLFGIYSHQRYCSSKHLLHTIHSTVSYYRLKVHHTHTHNTTYLCKNYRIISLAAYTYQYICVLYINIEIGTVYQVWVDCGF